MQLAQKWLVAPLLFLEAILTDSSPPQESRVPMVINVVGAMSAPTVPSASI
jgi:hypothetical protein